jgi:hypothetical protein
MHLSTQRYATFRRRVSGKCSDLWHRYLEGWRSFSDIGLRDTSWRISIPDRLLPYKFICNYRISSQPKLPQPQTWGTYLTVVIPYISTLSREANRRQTKISSGWEGPDRQFFKSRERIRNTPQSASCRPLGREHSTCTLTQKRGRAPQIKQPPLLPLNCVDASATRTQLHQEPQAKLL